MTRRSLSVRALADEADTSVDEVLVTLWDLGASRVLGPQDIIGHRDLKRARRALGVATRAELRTLRYWSNLLAVSEEGVRALLDEHGISMRGNATRLPPGGVGRLKAIARSRGIEPLTGVISSHDTQPALAPTGSSAARPATPQPAPESFEWRTPGHTRDLRRLSTEDVKRIHFALVDDFGRSADPIDPPGVRSEHLLASAIFRPQTAIGDTLKYPTVENAAAALLHALVLDHPFFNGNKRTALVSMLVFLDMNGVVPTCGEDAMFKLVLLVAQHRIADLSSDGMADREALAIADWLCGCTRLVEKGERPMPWRRLRKILHSYGCTSDVSGGVGNRIDIHRTVESRRRLFGGRRATRLSTQVFYRDEGSEAEVEVLKKIRGDLHLDDAHGVDSHDFYAKEPKSIPDFIATYRKTLYRLAKL
jgi:death-on-curing family protein